MHLYWGLKSTSGAYPGIPLSSLFLSFSKIPDRKFVSRHKYVKVMSCNVMGWMVKLYAWLYRPITGYQAFHGKAAF